MGKAIVLIGTTLSGKTTWSKKYLAENKNTYYVSRDSEREILFGEYRQGTSKEEEIITEVVNSKIWSFLKVGDVIIDNTHCRQEWLDAVIGEFSGSYDMEFVVFPALEKKELIKRNQLRFFETGKLIPEKVIHQQLKNLSELIIPENIQNGGKKTDKRLKNKQHNFDLPNCVIVDLDGTLSLMDGRNPFHGDTCGTDKVNNSVKRMLDFIGNESDIFIFSGRNSDKGGREATEKWLSDNNVNFGTLIMREEKDSRPDIVIKKEMYDKHIRDKYNVLFCIDDRDCVVKLWRDLGLDVFQVYYGNF